MVDVAKITNNAGLANIAYGQQVAATTQTNRQNSESSPQVSSDSSPVTDTVQVRSSVSLKNLDTTRAIEMMHASLNQLAKGIRETNEVVNTAVVQIDAMKKGVQGIIKNYPPLSVDSKERNDRLMQYTSLRKELLSLMVPAPPPPTYEKVQSMWSSLFDDNGQIKQAQVPSLDKMSSDPQLKDASQALDNTSSKLSEFSDKVTQALLRP